MESAQGKEAVPQTMPLADLPPVPQTAEVASAVSATIPKTLQPIKVCEVRLNGTTVAQPSILPSKDAAVLSNGCAMPTVPQPTPAPGPPFDCGARCSGIHHGAIACVCAAAGSTLNLFLRALPANIGADRRAP
ncbi:hypothetical protein MTO96_027140 [Rhipicephalus appendiculatus]